LFFLHRVAYTHRQRCAEARLPKIRHVSEDKQDKQIHAARVLVTLLKKVHPTVKIRPIEPLKPSFIYPLFNRPWR
jgi:hypothetical protein